MYWIYSNRTHVVLLQQDWPEGEPAQPSPALLAQMADQAALGFTAAGLSADKLTLLTYFTPLELQQADEPADLFLPPDAVLAVAAVAAQDLTEDDVAFDAAAVLSGWNVQAWHAVSPQVVVDWMLLNGPVLRRREVPDREQALGRKHQERLDAIARLLHRVVDPGEGLEAFVVVYREGEAVLSFACQAEDPDHANEQALNAYPEAEILATVALPPSARDALMLALAETGDEAAIGVARFQGIATPG